MSDSSEVPYGTLDLMVLKTLQAMGPLHGYGIARRIEQVAQGALALNQGTIYPALLRLEQKGWISSEWGTSENNRRARFYSITRRAGSNWPPKPRAGRGPWPWCRGSSRTSHERCVRSWPASGDCSCATTRGSPRRCELILNFSLTNTSIAG